jgi:hypothetical protein
MLKSSGISISTVHPAEQATGGSSSTQTKSKQTNLTGDAEFASMETWNSWVVTFKIVGAASALLAIKVDARKAKPATSVHLILVMFFMIFSVSKLVCFWFLPLFPWGAYACHTFVDIVKSTILTKNTIKMI